MMRRVIRRSTTASTSSLTATKLVGLLFGGSEVGVFYDPSDLYTMYQTSLGSTPVTAPGDPVGLILDKSQGLVLGSDLITNGSFDGGTTSWASGSSFTSTAAVVDGEMQVTPTADFGRQLQTLTLVVGRTYRITGSLRRISGASTNGAYVAVGYNSQGDSLVIAQSSSATAASFSAVFVPTHATVNICLSARTGNVGGFDNIVVKELAGNHARQATSAQRPTYQVDGSGRGYLLFDGIDDSLATSSFTPGIDKAQVFAGITKSTDAAIGMLLETGPNTAQNNGTLALRAPYSSAAADYGFVSRGTTARTVLSDTNSAPHDAVLTGIGDISGDVCLLRLNGVEVAQAVTDQGTGDYLANIMYIGRRVSSSLPFGGNVYQLLVRFGSNLSAANITKTETFIATKTGVTL